MSDKNQKNAFDPSGQNESAEFAHSLAAAEVVRSLGSEIQFGLDSRQAAERLRKSGKNEIKAKRPNRLLHFVRSQARSVVVWLLGTAAAVAWFTGSALEAIAIVVVLVLNAIFGFAIEWKAGRALDALRKTTITKTRVRRNGRERIVDASEIVPGDLIVLSSGDRIPADIRITESSGLRIDESMLTGESEPVRKNAHPVEPSTPLAERLSMLYLATNVVAGHAIGVVTSTGSATEIGRIGRLVAQAKHGPTPLETKLSELGRRLVYLVLLIALVVLIAGMLRGDEAWLMLEISISLAVAAVPEALPAVTTLILAVGVLKMARRNAIVRRLSAVETLGSSTVICADKTGTLTENLMTVRNYRLSDGNEIILPLKDGVETPTEMGDHLYKILRAGVLCNEAPAGEKTEDGSIAIGDPTETALLRAALVFGLDPKEVRRTYAIEFEKPFDSSTMMMTVVVGTETHEEKLAIIKGAPAAVFDQCGFYRDAAGNSVALDEVAQEEFRKVNRSMANNALRVLAFCEKDVPGYVEPERAVVGGFTFLGFAGIRDPLRAGVVESVKKAERAGIRIVMITGDQINTARAIARELREGNENEITAVHSKELLAADGKDLTELVKKADVFARVAPEDKLRIVHELQKIGEVVAVTGDGVNDAPALRHADIGVAMGMRGTDVAKESADIVLTDDNFKTIVKAIEDGRTIYSNIIRFVHLMFSQNLAEVLVIFAAIVTGLPLPLLPLQILWINLVTDVFPALALAVEPSSPGAMTRKPRPPGKTLLSGRFMLLVFWQGLLLAALAMASYVWALQQYGEGPHSRTVALLAVIGVQLGHLFNCRSQTRSAFNRFFSNPYIFAAALIVLILQAIAVYLPPLSKVLGTVRPNSADLFVMLLTIVMPIAVVEIVKMFGNRRRRV